MTRADKFYLALSVVFQICILVMYLVSALWFPEIKLPTSFSMTKEWPEACGEFRRVFDDATQFGRACLQATDYYRQFSGGFAAVLAASIFLQCSALWRIRKLISG